MFADKIDRAASMYPLRICLILILGLFFYSHGLRATVSDEQILQVCDVHVFIHGSYGTPFSFLSYSNIKKDVVKDTTYLAIQRAMRDTEWVRYNRFMDGEGMREVTPGSDLPKNHTARYVIGAFSAIHREIKQEEIREQRHFLFGWNGLLSQRERRRESIRLYNELLFLVEQIKAEGKKPILHLYGHSHGCNVMLNLALVDACCFEGAVLPIEADRNVIACMQKLLAGGAVSDLKDMLKQKFTPETALWYKKPTVRLDPIAELVLFGVPVQVETACLAAGLLFERVLQVYSENDGIPDKDSISSRSPAAVTFSKDVLRGHPNIKIVRWMHNRLSTDVCVLCQQQAQKNKKTSRFDKLKNFNPSRLQKIRDGGANPDSHHPLDPTHADFWSIGKNRDGAFFEQVPLVVFLPLLSSLVEQSGDAQQLDFCLLSDGVEASAGLFVINENIPTLAASGVVSLGPIEWARNGVLRILNVRKKLEIGLTFKSPFFKNFSFVKQG